MTAKHSTLTELPKPPTPTVAREPDELRPGTILLGRYRIEHVLGRGGMAIVYAASHVTIGAPVAIKVLHSSLAAKRTSSDRFLTEAKAIAAVQHANVVRVSDYGELEDGRPFMVMEHLRGHDLARRMEQTSPMSWSSLRPTVVQVCAALQAAHDAGIVHCDVKPQNIFLLDEGAPFARVKVLDFGIAKVSDAEHRPGEGAERVFVGTPDYMAPEQASDAEIDARADVYALGVTLYYALTGRLPFVSKHWFHTVTQHMYREPMPPRAINPQIPEDVEDLVLRALQKRPEDRFASMRAMAEAAEAASERVHVSTPTLSSGSLAATTRGRGFAVRAAAAVIAATTLFWGAAALDDEPAAASDSIPASSIVPARIGLDTRDIEPTSVARDEIEPTGTGSVVDGVVHRIDIVAADEDLVPHRSLRPRRIGER